MCRRVGHRRARRLLHHVAELAGEDERYVAPTAHLGLLVVAGTLAVAEQPPDCRLDEHDVAARRRVEHAGCHAHLVLLGGVLWMYAGTAEELANLVSVDLSVLDHLVVIARDLARHLARDGADLPLELTHARL